MFHHYHIQNPENPGIDYHVFDRGRTNPVVTLIGRATRIGPPAIDDPDQQLYGTISFDFSGLPCEKVLRMLQNYRDTGILLFPDTPTTKALLGPRVRWTVYFDPYPAFDTLDNPQEPRPATFLTTAQKMFSFYADRVKLKEHLHTMGSYSPLRPEIVHRRTPYNIIHDFLHRTNQGSSPDSSKKTRDGEHIPGASTHASLEQRVDLPGRFLDASLLLPLLLPSSHYLRN
ncbi:hypothetical protein HYW21_00055 [Candidatus Woesearchaeota archaeon]|nr:hypothetical protein [Candidatus Woesearchaeota archaeon]